MPGKPEGACGDQVTGLAMGDEGGAMMPQGEGGPEHDNYGESGEDETKKVKSAAAEG